MDASVDWAEVPPERRLSAAWLQRHYRETYLQHSPYLFSRWLERLAQPSCMRAVTCIFHEWLYAPCVGRAAPGERYCVRHGGQPFPRRPVPLNGPARTASGELIPPALRALTTRTRSALMRNGYLTAESVQAAPDHELLHLRNFGDRCLEEVREVFGYASIRRPGATHPWWLGP